MLPKYVASRSVYSRSSCAVGLQRGVVAADRDLALDAGGVDARQHARRDPALAAAVARAVRLAPLGREPERARELVRRSVDLDRHAVAVGQRARHDVLQELARQRIAQRRSR